MFRVSVVGLGHKGRAHVLDVRGRADALVVAACDPDPAACARAAEAWPDVKLFPDVASMVTGCPADVLVVACPPRQHLAAVRSGFHAEMHVFCEKPFGINATETATMAALATQANRRLGTGLNLRCLPAVRAAKALIQRGTVGTVLSVQGMWTRSSMLPGTVPYPPLWYRSVAEGGGVLRDLGSHMLDAGLYFVGYPAGGINGYAIPSSRHARLAAATLDPALGVEDSAWVLLEHDAGPIMTCYTSWTDQADGRETLDIRIIGGSGELRIRGHAGKTNLRLEVIPRVLGAHGHITRPRRVTCPAEARTPLGDFLHGIATAPGTLADHRELTTLAMLLDAIGEGARTRAAFRCVVSGG